MLPRVNADSFRPNNLNIAGNMRELPESVFDILKQFLLNLGDAKESAKVYQSIISALVVNGWALDGANNLQRAEVDKPKLFAPWSFNDHNNENYRPLAQLKDSVVPNRDSYDDRDTIMLIIYAMACPADVDTGEGIEVLFKDKKSPFSPFLGCTNCPMSRCFWGNESTPLITHTHTDTNGSRGKRFDASVHGPFYEAVLEQLVFLTMDDSYHNYFIDAPSKTATEIKLFNIFTEFGFGVPGYYMSNAVTKVLLSCPDDMRWSKHWLNKEHMTVFLTPSAKLLATMPYKIKSKATLIDANMVENVDFYTDKERICREVFAFGPLRPVDNREPLKWAANMPFESYVRASVLIRNRLLYFLGGMDEVERQRMLDIAKGHNSDLSKKRAIYWKYSDSAV